MERRERNVFVTVGTTRFDKLVQAVTSTTGLEWMTSNGYNSLTVQYGTGEKVEPDSAFVSSDGRRTLKIKAYGFQPSLDEDMRKADLIISHAGAGTVMEVLRLRKKLIVVINTDLMNNHQTELAEAMAGRDHLFMVPNPEVLLSDMTIWNSFVNFRPIPHQAGNENDFVNVLDDALGFSTNKTD